MGRCSGWKTRAVERFTGESSEIGSEQKFTNVNRED